MFSSSGVYFPKKLLKRSNGSSRGRSARFSFILAGIVIPCGEPSRGSPDVDRAGSVHLSCPASVGFVDSVRYIRLREPPTTTTRTLTRLRNHQRIDTPACSDPDALAKDSTLRPLFMLVFVLLAALLCESPLAMGEC